MLPSLTLVSWTLLSAFLQELLCLGPSPILLPQGVPSWGTFSPTSLSSSKVTSACLCTPHQLPSMYSRLPSSYLYPTCTWPLRRPTGTSALPPKVSPSTTPRPRPQQPPPLDTAEPGVLAAPLLQWNYSGLLQCRQTGSGPPALLLALLLETLSVFPLPSA